MFKLYIVSILLYFAYRTIIKPMLPSSKQNLYEEDDKIDDSEYIDYEEVD